jgi:hypothetical protein
VHILADACGHISPHIKRSFAKRWYSPSTGMDRSECKIMLEQHLIMDFIVKEDVVKMKIN